MCFFLFFNVIKICLYPFYSAPHGVVYNGMKARGICDAEPWTWYHQSHYRCIGLNNGLKEKKNVYLKKKKKKKKKKSSFKWIRPFPYWRVVVYLYIIHQPQRHTVSHTSRETAAQATVDTIVMLHNWSQNCSECRVRASAHVGVHIWIKGSPGFPSSMLPRCRVSLPAQFSRHIIPGRSDG